MKLQSAAIALLWLMAMPSARTEETATLTGSKLTLTYEDVRKIARRWRPIHKTVSSATYGSAPASRRATAAL